MSLKLNQKICFCGCEDFKISKSGKWFIIHCSKCSCKRQIKSPGIAVDKYTVSIPFKGEED